MVDTRRTARHMEVGGTSQGEDRESTPIVNAGDRPATTENVNAAPPPVTTDPPTRQQAGNTGHAEFVGTTNDWLRMFAARLTAVEQRHGRDVIEIREPRTELEDNLKILEKFMKLKPPGYDGEPNVDKAESWIEMMEKIFETMGCAERQMVILATFRLQGAAEYWWRMIKDKWERAHTVWTWARFTQEFQKHFVPSVVSDKREAAFLALEQNDLTIAQYEAMYSALARYNPHLIPDETAKARRFVSGLRAEFRTSLVALQLTEYSEAVERSYNIENDIDRTRMKREHVQRQTSHDRQEQVSGNKNRGRFGNNQSGQSRLGNLSLQQAMRSIATLRSSCDFCGKKSHTEAECRKKLGTCVGCGASDHQADDCPRWKPKVGPNANQSTARRKRTSDDRPTTARRALGLGQRGTLNSTNVRGGTFNVYCTRNYELVKSGLSML